jgi:hypothetical protein
LGRAVGRPGRLRGGRAWTALRTLGDDDLAGDRISGYLALIEGDATRIQHAYVRSLPDDDRDRYLDAIGQASGEAQEELDTVPGVLVAMEGAPYALGPSLVELIAADGGNDAVDEAFDDPPATTEHMVDPRSYFAGDSAHEVTAPVVPTGGERIGEHDRLGALPLFLLLSERVRALPFHQLVQANESAEPSAAIVTAIERAVSDCRVA